MAWELLKERAPQQLFNEKSDSCLRFGFGSSSNHGQRDPNQHHRRAATELCLTSAGWQTRRSMGSKITIRRAILVFLNKEIGLWNGAFNPDLTSREQSPLRLMSTVSATHHRIMLSPATTYVVFHFGNGAAGGSPGGWWQAWNLDGLGGIIHRPHGRRCTRSAAFLRLAITTPCPGRRRYADVAGSCSWGDSGGAAKISSPNSNHPRLCLQRGGSTATGVGVRIASRRKDDAVFDLARASCMRGLAQDRIRMFAASGCARKSPDFGV